MRFAVATELKMLDGSPLKDPQSQAPMTIGWLAANVLSAALDDTKVSQAEKLRRFKLALDINGATDAVEMTVDDIALVKKLVDKCYPAPLISGQFALLIEDVKG